MPTRLSTLVILLLHVFAIAPLSAERLEAESSTARFRLRPLDQAVGDLLWQGYQDSETFRHVVGLLVGSDVIVHLAIDTEERLGHAGTTRFAGGRGGQRYLRIAVAESTLPRSSSIAVLGHELYHALEVASASWVVDARSHEQLYKRIGYSSCRSLDAPCYETKEAGQVGSQILAELRSRTLAQSATGRAFGILSAAAKR